MIKHSVRAARSAQGSQAGFTMLELMVSITISLFILLAVSNIFIANQQTLTAQSGNALMTDNGRIGLAVIGRLLKQSGYCDEASYSNTDASGNWVIPCRHINNAAASGSAGSDAYSQISLVASAGVAIASASTSFTLSNGSSASLSAMGQNSDTLSISYITGPQAASYTGMPDCLGNPTPAASNVIVTNTFYIKVQGVGTGSNPQVIRPQLMCNVSWTDINGNALSSSLTSSLVSSGVVAENIERIGVLLGVDSGSDGVPDYYAPPDSSISMSKVYAVRVVLLARQDPVYNQTRASTTTFNMFGASYGATVGSGDNSWVAPLASGTVACSVSNPCWARRLYDSTFVLRNRMS
jgi:prepilin-type N-terminal cleavage/methylation domain-containing protein